MIDAEWFETYDGPKAFAYENGRFLVAVGWNRTALSGRVSGEEIREEDSDLLAAIARLRSRFQGAID